MLYSILQVIRIRHGFTKSSEEASSLGLPTCEVPSRNLSMFHRATSGAGSSSLVEAPSARTDGEPLGGTRPTPPSARPVSWYRTVGLCFTLKGFVSLRVSLSTLDRSTYAVPLAFFQTEVT